MVLWARKYMDYSLKTLKVYLGAFSPGDCTLKYVEIDFGILKRSRQRCRYLALEFESVADTGKIDEVGYNIVPIEARDSTLTSLLRSAERKRILTFYGRYIIEACILPIGSYSEEAQKGRNKHNRQYRELFTRKSSKINTNTDLLRRLLIISYPYIASLRAAPKAKKKLKMDREMKKKMLELCLSDEEDSVIVSEDSSEESSSSE
ncbi:hypothetical protein AVEN_175802-1 [Araneus ventricosus]|uniref:Uncharacterized protein n=1 Tax=Araneus ventricosus TaxID=182803 RepID=A0A4Y2U0U2_ARAVE|nr:hypothetical protein AVEN_267522-1 [Araneus ventricosus]GBO05310.1 hypothetical protein AVEN_175802-1 [Araneus ventricosus]